MANHNVRGQMTNDKPNTGGTTQFYEHFTTTRQHNGGQVRFKLTKISKTQNGANVSGGLQIFLRRNGVHTKTLSFGPGDRSTKTFGVLAAGRYAISARFSNLPAGYPTKMWFHGQLQLSLGPVPV